MHDIIIIILICWKRKESHTSLWDPQLRFVFVVERFEFRPITPQHTSIHIDLQYLCDETETRWSVSTHRPESLNILVSFSQCTGQFQPCTGQSNVTIAVSLSQGTGQSNVTIAVSFSQDTGQCNVTIAVSFSKRYWSVQRNYCGQFQQKILVSPCNYCGQFQPRYWSVQRNYGGQFQGTVQFQSMFWSVSTVYFSVQRNYCGQF